MKSAAIFALAAGAALLVMKGGNMGKGNLPLGIRLNNPGNIEQTDPPIQWDGLELVQQHLPYLAFISPEYGMRAMALNLKSYELHAGVDTIRAMITRWAPPSDHNNTEAYIADVSQRTGIPADQRISLVKYMHVIVPAIIWHENGMQPYTKAQIGKALAMAGIPA